MDEEFNYFRVEEVRKKHAPHMKKQDAAAAMGMARETYSRRIKGEGKFTVADLLKLAQAFEVHPGMFFGEFTPKEEALQDEINELRKDLQQFTRMQVSHYKENESLKAQLERAKAENTMLKRAVEAGHQRNGTTGTPQ